MFRAMSSPRAYQRFFAELKRRKVFRVAAGYGAATFVAIQVADVVFPRIPLPDWTVSFVVWLSILGFPFALVAAWLFERTAAGLRRTEEAPEGEIEALVAQPASRRWPSGLAALAGAGLLAAGVWTAWKVATPTATEIAESRLAVFPFGVTGSAGLGWLDEGLPTLLSQNLFEPGESETVDPVRVLKLVGREAGRDGEQGAMRAVDVRSAGNFSRELGAGRFVMGSVQGTGGRVRINAGLYALRDSIETIGRAEVEGDTAALFELVDGLTAQLLGSGREFGAANRDLVTTAAHTTSSLPALKAYLEGEKQLRDGDTKDARESLATAVELDSTFALAAFRKAFAHLVGFDNWSGEAAEWVGRALRHADRLSEYDRRTAEAFSAAARGDIEGAERGYRGLVSAYPSRLDARVLLTLLLADYDQVRGRPIDEAARLYEDLRRADPGYLCLACLGSNIYITKGDFVSLSKDWVAGLEAAPDSAESAAGLVMARAAVALATGDTAAWNESRRTLLPALNVDSVFWQTYPFIALEDGRIALADTLVDVDFARADGTPIHTTLDFARGRWQEAYEGLAKSSPATLLGYLQERAFSLPIDAESPGAADAAATSLAWSGPVARNGTIWDALGPHVRLYGAALLSIQANRDSVALAYADSLASLPIETEFEPLVRNLVRAVRGEAALRAGDFARARSQLDELEWEMSPAALEAGWRLGFDRIYVLRGEAAWRAGAVEEARRWFDGGTANWRKNDYSLIELRRGQIDEADGRIEAARVHYAHVVEALEPADDVLVPRREEARSRLAELLEAGDQGPPRATAR